MYCRTIISASFLVALAATGLAAETVHLYLKSNGEDIQGETATPTPGRVHPIVCLSFDLGGQVVPFTSATGSSGAPLRTYTPVVIRKLSDRATPLLWKAMTNSESIDAEFRFFRLGRDGLKHFYTITLKQARITSMRNVVEGEAAPNRVSLPMDEVTLIFQSITWTFQDGEKVTHADALGKPTTSASTPRPALVRPPKSEVVPERKKNR